MPATSWAVGPTSQQVITLHRALRWELQSLQAYKKGNFASVCHVHVFIVFVGSYIHALKVETFPDDVTTFEPTKSSKWARALHVALIMTTEIVTILNLICL
jgi:hypothetical protein